jgi:hypothetical protein
VRTLAATSLALLTLILTACSGTPDPTITTGPLNGNWQINMLQQYPTQTPLSASGFIAQADDAIEGSIQVAPVGAKSSCGGVSAMTGTISGQNVTFSLNEGGSVVNFTGTISSNNQSMSGDYQAIGGACFTTATSGTWDAVLVPPLNGNFTGTIDSTYMELVDGVTTPVPVSVSGSFTQSSNAGASNASIAGTITAVGYPCFTTASLSGTISGESVYLDVFGDNGELIGTLGAPAGTAGSTGTPANVVLSSSGPSLVGGTISDPGLGGLYIGINNGKSVVGPCPAITSSGNTSTSDDAFVDLSFKQPAQ